MSSVAEHFSKSKSLLKALDAMSNRSAFFMVIATMISVALLMSLTATITTALLYNGHTTMGSISGIIGTLIVIVVGLTGMSATGFLINAQMRDEPIPSMSNAIITALVTLPRFIGVYLLLGLVLVGLMLAILVLLLICKIPGIGPVLYTFVFPICVLTAGIALYASIYITALTAPAIWNGNTVMSAITTLMGITQQRLLPVIVQTLLLTLLVSVVGSIIFGAIFLGMGLVSALSIPVLGFNAGGGNPASVMMLMMQGGTGYASGYVMAGLIGSALIGAIAITLPAMIAIAGYCQIYANVLDGLNLAAMEKKIQDARNKAKDARSKAQNSLIEAQNKLAEKTKNNVATANSSADSSADSSSIICTNCQAPVAPGDVFCGGCGTRL